MVSVANHMTDSCEFQQRYDKGLKAMNDYRFLQEVLGVSGDIFLMNWYLRKFTLRYQIKHTAVIYFIYWLWGIISCFLPISSCLKSISDIVIMSVLIYYLYDKVTMKDGVKLALLCYIVINLSELAVITIGMLLTKTYHMQIFFAELTFVNNLALVILSRLLSFGGLHWISKKELLYEGNNITMREVLIMYLPVGLVFLLLLLADEHFIVCHDLVLNADATIALLILLVFAILLVVLYVNFWSDFLTLKNKNIEIEVLKERNKIQSTYQKNTAEDIETLRILQHDLRNHLLLAKSGLEYVGKILERVNKTDKYIDTGNRLLDILLYEKTQEAHEIDVDIKFFMTTDNLDFLEDLDICSIFGNILDNALESCKAIEGQSERQIELKVSSIQDFVMIIMENNCPEISKRVKGNSLIRTTKPDKKFHGIGLLSLKRSLEKYGGSYSYEQQKGRFKTKILIPIPESTD